MAKAKIHQTPKIYQRTLSISGVSTVAAGIEAPPPIVNQLSTGMPSLDTVTGQAPFKSPVGGKYLVLRTNEIDSYEKIPVGLSINEFLAVTPLPVSDKFAGTARKAAKLSIAAAETEDYSDLKALIESLVAEDDMINHTPKITTKATSNRVEEEKRNVRVRAWIYAASREADNDFHLIVGRNPTKTPAMYMTMELSGLPGSSSKFYKQLKVARDEYKSFFKDRMPGLSYDFYQPPVPVEVEGSLFFDMSHSNGQRPGPPSLKSRMPTIWEVHPISKIVFEP